MFNGLASLARLMSNPQAIQEQAQQMKQRLAEMRLTATSEGGYVEVVVSGDHRVISMVFSESYSELEKEEMERHTYAACNAAFEQARQTTAEELSKLTQGLGLPGLDKFLQM